MNNEFKRFVDKLIVYSKSKQDDEEENVSYEEALKACYYITHIIPRQLGDLLLYCGSLSLMNRYVKQEGSEFYNKYIFKSNGLIRLVDLLNKCSFIEGFQMMFEHDANKENSTLLYTSICDMHFSFHSVSKKLKNSIPKEYLGEFEWDGIRKQVCASSLFRMIEDNNLLLSRNGYKTLNIKESAKEIALDVINGRKSKRQFLQECNFYHYCEKVNKKNVSQE